MEKKIVSNITIISCAFLGVGTILALIAVILRYQNNFLLSDFFLSLSVSVFSVTIIEIIWRTLGGGPVEKQLSELSQLIPLWRNELSQLILLWRNELLQLIPLWRKCKDFGVTDIFVSRCDMDIREMLRYVQTAREVDMMGISLRVNWTENESFMNILSENVRTRRCHFRILVLNPSSSIAAQRAKDEDSVNDRFMGAITETLKGLKQIYDELGNEVQDFLQIRTLSEYTMYCSIIRIDRIMLVTFYMCSQPGNYCPTIIINGETPLFIKFKNEFEKLWKFGQPWT